MERTILYLVIVILLISTATFLILYLQQRSQLTTNYIPIVTDDNHQLRVKLISEKPRIMIYRNFLTPTECEHLIKLADGRFNRSEIQTASEEKVSAVRTSHSCYLQSGEDDIVSRVEARATALAALPRENLEPLQVVRYQPGQYYNPHYDFFVPGADGSDEALKRGGQRKVTFFAYLNDLPSNDKGGHTYFDKIDLRIKPKKGTAVFWLNCTPDGKEDYLTHHAGESPTEGIKYGLNVWFREGIFS